MGGIDLAQRSPIDGVIFDLDGVITLTASVHAAAWKRLFDGFLKERAKGTNEPFKPFDIEADYRTYVDGKPRVEGVKSFLKSRGIELPEGSRNDSPDAPTAWGLGNRKNIYFQQIIAERGVEIDERTVVYIRQLRDEGIPVAVASSSKNCSLILKRAKLDTLFDAQVDGVVSEELGLKGKPAPDIFIEAARRIGAAPEHSVVVEDAISGVQAGRAGRFGLVIGIDRTDVATELRENGADLILQGFDEGSFDVIMAWFEYHEERRPSILQEWPTLSERLRGRRITLFLDYDGTLTPIVERPELALLSDRDRDVLKRTADRFPTAIISGRGREDVERLVGLSNLAYAGSHGFDIVGPHGASVDHAAADWIKPVMADVTRKLGERLKGVPGVIIEPKVFSVAVHYRLVEERRVPEIEEAVDEIVRRDQRLKKTYGKKVFEVRPNIDWDKGKALNFLMRALGLDDEEAIPIYIGDDTTDEDAFAAIQGDGIGILVSETPRATKASYWVQAPWEVYAFLERLLKLDGGERE